MVESRMAKKFISDKRREQNRRAQKDYRNRQKRQLEHLKQTVEARDVKTAELSESSPGVPEVGSAQLQRESLIRYLEAHRPISGALCARVLNGEITLQDILGAGLEALSRESNPSDGKLQISTSSAHTSEEEQPKLRTDKILVLEKDTYHDSKFPDIYTNNLHIKLVSGVAALRANAEVIGLPFEKLIDPESTSHFYITASNASWQDTALDLRPTPAQLTYEHEPYIDCIPFPLFRERACTLIASESPLFDEYDFCADVEKEGLVCWGYVRGDGRDVRGTGTPWDRRSWEMRGWFRAKWGWLFFDVAERGVKRVA